MPVQPFFAYTPRLHPLRDLDSGVPDDSETRLMDLKDAIESFVADIREAFEGRGGANGNEGNGEPGTLVVDDSGTLDATLFEGRLEGVDTLRFTSNVTVDSDHFAEVDDIVLEDGGTISNLNSDQTVTALNGSVDGEGDPLILKEAGGEVNIVTDFGNGQDPHDAEETLELIVEPTSEELEAPYQYEFGTLTLSGNGAISYEDTGRGFKEIDASELTGGLEFSGNTYVWEQVTLGEGADTLNMAGRSNYHSADYITGFDPSADTLDVISGEYGRVEVIEPEVDTWGREALMDAEQAAIAASSAHDGAYVAYEADGSTYILADTEGRVPGQISDGDFKIKLVGTTGLTDSLAAEGAV